MNKIVHQCLIETIDDFNKEIILNPGFTDSYCTRGALKFCIDDINGAFADWSRAVEMGCPKTLYILSYLTML